jgi:hypothetical protein
LEPAVCGRDDALGVGGPDEELWAVVVLGEIAVDSDLQIDQRVKDAAF